MKRNFPCMTLVWVTIFAIAMGFLETSVVVYMRALLYPKGFVFPLAPIPQSLAMTEVFREAATLIMLVGTGILAGRNAASRFGWFLYAFAIWDIFYYVFLKLLINWPESFMTWDILFLIPTTWVGPVISPLLVSTTMIVLGMFIVYYNSGEEKANPDGKQWFLFIMGSLILILSFTWDYSDYILEHYRFSDLWSVPANDLLQVSLSYIPRKFNWILFCSGEAIILAGIAGYWRRNRIAK